MPDSRSTASSLRAAAAIGDITPAMGIQLAGDIGRHRPVEEIRERLYARVLILEQDGKRAVIISTDLLAMGTQWADATRKGVAQVTGAPLEAVVAHNTQNHAAPTLGGFFVSLKDKRMPAEHPWLAGGDERFNQPTVDKIVATAREAAGKLRPVTVAAGRATDGRVAYNRRFLMRDGTTRCHPPQCSPDILQVEGPTDPEVGVITFTGEDGAVVAAMLHHTCHPCHGYNFRFVIADWPGAWCDAMRDRLGPGAMPMVINGCCGNIHHRNHLDPDYKQDHLAMGRMLGQTACRVLDNMTPIASPTLDWRRTTMRLPLREIPDFEIDAARKLYEKNPQPMWIDKVSVQWDWVYAVSMLDLAERRAEQPWFDYEVQALRIGDAALVTVMGEPFVEAQLAIKKNSPARFTQVAHFCNGFAGYMPTREALTNGGYETRIGNWSKFGPEAVDRLVETAGGLLRQLF